MSDVIEVGSDTWTVEHDFSHSLTRKLCFADSTSVFNVDTYNHWNADVYGISGHLELTVTSAESPVPYTIEYKINNRSLGWSGDGKMTETKTKSPELYCLDFKNSVSLLELKLTDPKPKSNIAFVGGSLCPLQGDLKSFIERGQTVTLIGHDGNVTVPKRILKLRSTALEAMFNHDSQEKLTGQIELKDFNKQTLEAFGHFLMTGDIIYGKETALGLIILGDKYDIQKMKEAGEDFVKRNIKRMDKDDLIDVWSKVSRDLLYDVMVGFWAKK